jgi:hypothetical protein
MEQRSRHAGRDYTLHPVVVRGGIFHPKLIHLWSESGDGDKLLVGSGNLTYAGHGGNLEVFEVLEPETHATAFAQAADFFSELAGARHVDIGGAQRPLLAVQRRMAALAEKHAPNADVQFIHSLIEPAIPQLVRHLAGRDFDELVVMSPYHNQDAAPIAELVAATRPGRVLISLDSAARSSPFPFDLAEGWPCELHAVAAGDSKSRFPHAKWYEWRAADGAVALTGSFNATTASLATSHNVECGVLRRLPTASSHWREVARRPFAAQPFPRSQAHAPLIASATLAGRTISGRIAGLKPDQPRNWTFTVQNDADAPQLPQPTTLDANGNFEAELGIPVDTTLEKSIQIHMESGELRARGWVTLPDILNIAPRQRNLLSLLGRFERGAGTAVEFASLLGVLMDEIRVFNQETEPDSPPRKPADNHGKGPTVDRDRSTVPRDSVTDGPAPRDRFLAALADGQRDWTTWGHLGEILLGAGGADAATQGTSSADSRGGRPPRLERPAPETEEEAREVEREADILGAALTAFQDLMASSRSTLRDQVKLSDAAGRGEALMALARFERMWLHVTLRALVGHLNDIAGATEWLGRWLRDNAHVGYDEPSLDLVLPQLAGCAAVLSMNAGSDPDAFYSATVARRAPSVAARAVPYLEAAFNGAPDVDRVLEGAATWFNNQICNELVNDAPDVALRALAAALARPTPRSMVERFLRERPSKVVPAEWRPLPQHALDLLKAAIRPPGRRPPYGKVDVRDLGSGCPLCYRSLEHTRPGSDVRHPDADFLAELKLLSVAACIRCKEPLIERSALPRIS